MLSLVGFIRHPQRLGFEMVAGDLQTEIFVRNLIKSNQIQIIFTIF